MSESVDKSSRKQFTELQERIRRLKKRLDRQKDLETRLNETLHSLRVHQEELRTQNDDLIAAQKEITQSQRKYRDLFDFAPIGYFLINAAGVIQEANLTGAKMIGRDRGRIGGKPFFLYLEPACRAIFDRHLREIWEGHPASAELVFMRKTGDMLPVELFSIPVQDDPGRISQCRIAATDISKRRQAVKALQESESRLDSIVKTIPDIVYRLDPNGMISFISEGIRRYGYMPGELLGKSMMNLIHPQDRSTARYKVNERRTGARSTNNLELRVLTQNKLNDLENGAGSEERFFLVNAEGLYAETNQASKQFIGTQGIAHDITQRKKSEFNRRQLEAELQKARRMEAIGTLAGGIAHDFNNLLMGIQGSISMMRMDMQHGEQDLQPLDQIDQCVRRGSELTRQLLGFAKSGKFNVKTIDINKIVADTAQLFGRTRKMIKIQQNLAADLLPVDADEGQLEQVLLNLLINADQAMPKGGKIILATEKIEPEFHQRNGLGLKPGKYLRIRVEDTGIGMDEQTKSRIFEPFFTTKEMGRGTGLGLASAYGIVKNHGGMIDVASSPGRGSQFFVYLPASSGSVSAENEVSRGIIKGDGTILLVDDEDIITDVGGKMLERLGYRVIIAEDGRQALGVYQERHQDIDLVILDMIMPEMSGLETYNRLKTINPKIKVLLSSGYSRQGQVGEIVARDNQDFIQKPFDLALLSQKIAAIRALP
jgi:PAS domain S-box-containing protein